MNAEELERVAVDRARSIIDEQLLNNWNGRTAEIDGEYLEALFAKAGIAGYIANIGDDWFNRHYSDWNVHLQNRWFIFEKRED